MSDQPDVGQTLAMTLYGVFITIALIETISGVFRRAHRPGRDFIFVFSGQLIMASLLIAQPANEVNLAAGAEQQQALALEEVYVTAQKRTESLQDTPISLAAFNEDQLEKDGIANLGDLAAKVPSLTLTPFPINNTTLNIFIRGVGLGDNQITQDSPVGIYLDGIYIARNAGLSLDIAELQRIEVLRGPQGTLYGRNSTGGAINLITRRPEVDEFGFRQTLSVGNRNLFTSKTSINVPVSDRAAFKLAYLASRRDGFIENEFSGENFGDRDVSGLRLDFSWDISDRLRLDYGYDRSELEYVNYPYQAVIPQTPTAGTPPASTIQNQLENDAARYYTYSAKRTESMSSSGVPMLASNAEISGHALNLSWDASDNSELKYSFAYRELQDGSYADLTASGTADYRVDYGAYTSKDGSVHVPATVPVITQDQISHELQWLGSTLDERLEYILGYYYFEEQGDENNLPKHPRFVGVLNRVNAGAVTTTTYLNNFAGKLTRVENEAQALFGRLSWTPPVLDERLQLTLGARYSEDSRKAFQLRDEDSTVETETRDTITGVITASTPPSRLSGVLWSQAADRDFDDVSVEFIAEFELNETINFYGKYAEAYKSGGFNIRDPDQERFARGFDAEKIASWELGIKSDLLNRRLRLNADVFLSEFTDQQVNFALPSAASDTQLVNTGESEMRGLELDLIWLASRWLRANFNYAYLEAETLTAVDPSTGQDDSEKYVFGNVPKNSYTLALDATLMERRWGRLAANVSYNHMDQRNGTSLREDVEIAFLREYSLLNARLGLYEAPILSGQLGVALWGKNLEDTEYEISTLKQLIHADRAVIWGESRTYGLDVSYIY